MNLPTSVVITGIDSLEILDQALEAVTHVQAADASSRSRDLLARTATAAADGQFERFKTSDGFDGTAQHPEWLG